MALARYPAILWLIMKNATPMLRKWRACIFEVASLMMQTSKRYYLLSGPLVPAVTEVKPVARALELSSAHKCSEAD